MNSSRFRMMKKTAYIINTSLGQIINERHIIQALNRKIIAGAALDVVKSPHHNALLTMKMW
jgi:lactate dehydrogenase-like 2-hydroxyacid dehydrogenase